MAAKLTLLEEDWTRQPPASTKIDWNNPFTKGLIFDWEASHGPVNIAGYEPAYSSKGVKSTTPSGLSNLFTGDNPNNLNWGHQFSYSPSLWGRFSGSMQSTVEILFIPRTSATVHIFGSWNIESGNHFLVQQISGTDLVWLPAEDNSGNRRRWDAAGVFSIGKINRVLLVWRGGSDKEIWVNGVDKTSLLTAVNTDAMSIRTNPYELAVCQNQGGTPNNDVIYARIWNRGFSTAEASVYSRKSAWQIFEPEEIPLFKPITSGVVTLAILEALHGHTGDNIAFSLDTFLSAQDASHAQSAENLTLDASTAISLILSEAFHGLSSDVISFITGSYLQVADALHGHSADSLTLATASFLAVADTLHAHSSENLTLDTSNATPLTPQDSAHAHSADNTALTLDTWLAIVEAIHAQSADNVSISSEELLAVADALHSLASDALVLSLPSAPGTCPTAAEIAAAVLAAAQITPIYADIRKVNNLTVDGTGTDGDPWGPV